MSFHSNAPLLLRSTLREPRYSRAPAACYPFPAPFPPHTPAGSVSVTISLSSYHTRRRAAPRHHRTARKNDIFSFNLPKRMAPFPATLSKHRLTFHLAGSRAFVFLQTRPPTLAPVSPIDKRSRAISARLPCRDKIPVIPIKRIHVASPAANRAESVLPSSPPRRRGRMVRFSLIATRSRISYGEWEGARKARRYSGAVIPSGGLRRAPFSPLSAPVSAPQSASGPC